MLITAHTKHFNKQHDSCFQLDHKKVTMNLN